ncbi:MAG: family 78 glycoside hydrolase catalytic domain [Spirochaetes bacterium]|nr:family 78 glycoside hydrolase catalytic domain [Spirochaetota bacterium]
MLQPTRLRCEYLVDAVGIDCLEPRLSWVLQTDHPDRRGERQTGWQIIVRRDAGAVAWNSGRVASDETAQIVYRGRLLEPCARYRWKVRVWDGAGRPSAWSLESSWTMGPWGPGWTNARANNDPRPAVPMNWIGEPLPATWNEREGQASPLLRREFTLPGPVRRAVVFASALGIYELHLNGRKVGDRALAPEWTDYHRRVQYQGYDVTGLLVSGPNAIGAMLAPGWFAGQLGLGGDFLAIKRGFYGRHLRFAAYLHAELESGTVVSVTTGPDWKVSMEGPIRSSDLLAGETYDARREVPGWDRPGYDDSRWIPVFCRMGPVLSAQPNEPIRVVTTLAPVALTEPSPGVFIYDLGQNFAGWVRMHLEGEHGAEVRFRHAEMLDADGRIYRDNLRLDPKDSRSGAQQEDRYVCRGNGEEVFEPRFTYHGFRYVEVTGLAYKPSLEDLEGRVVHSDATAAGEFSSSNALLDRIMRAIGWTQDSNLHGVPTDCPQRDERLGWAGDIQVFSQAAMFNRDMAGFFTKWLRDLREGQAADGRIPDFAPHALESEVRFSGNPGWGDAITVIPWRQYVTYGDRRILEESFESARRWLDWSERGNPDLLWRYRQQLTPIYGDWLNADTFKDIPGLPRKGGEVPKEVYATAWFAHSASLTARMAGVLGRTEDERRYADLSNRVTAAFNRAYVSKDGRIRGDTQAGYALALSFDLLPVRLRPIAARRMVAAFKRYHGALSTGFISTVRMMNELVRWGYAGEAYRLALRREMPSWGYMIDHGGTTIWERWDGWVEGRGFQNPSMNSFNHYAIGSVGEWVWRTVAGINPCEDEPGCRRVEIRPVPGGGLTETRAVWRTIRGPVGVAWQASRQVFEVEVSIPPNMRATVVLPTAAGSVVTEGAVPVAKAHGVRVLGRRQGTIRMDIGSGTYRFTVMQGKARA